MWRCAVGGAGGMGGRVQRMAAARAGATLAWPTGATAATAGAAGTAGAPAAATGARRAASTARVLADDELAHEIDRQSAAGWQYGCDGGEQYFAKHVRFKSFRQATAFVMAVSLAAERQQHHPAIYINHATVQVQTTTTDPRGISTKDVKLMAAVDRQLAALAAGECTVASARVVFGWRPQNP
ncbi:pterin 4 alpha carbinolamine dehydratase-domain-containing protein [Dipodascopsis tothii]|uniref:pterin 4 alpha carbinolamine dehydratase-domain-containing protein n=1 Tax=Dipodascopsis tothii TaxID=44089 RepID=UPI0034CD9507